MTQPSKGAAAFLTLFGLSFLCGGLASAYAQLVSHRNFDTFQLALGIMVASVFAFIGGGLIYAAFRGYALLKQQAARMEGNPLSPWLWRTDWASRRAESRNKKSEINYWVICILCNMITLPVAANLVPKMVRANDPRVFLVLGFSSLGLILLVNTLRATIRHRRFGDTYFEFDALPFLPGEKVSGRIHLKFETRAEHGVDLKLSCVRKIVTGSGDSRSTSKVVLWEADQNVPAGAVQPGPLGLAIPVEFSVPADSLVTNLDNPNDQVLWILHAQADVPGVDYSDDFEIPVFRGTTSSAPASNFGMRITSGADTLAFPASQPTETDSNDVPQPAHIKAVVSPSSGGTEFYFPPLRNPSRALILLVVTVVWSAVIYLMYQKHAPMLFFVLFGLTDVLIIAGFLHTTFGSSLISVRSGEILSRRGILGLGRARTIQVSEVVSILPVVSMQQGGSSDNALHAIRMRLKDGRKIRLADEIASRQEARWVVSQIETLSGLKLDTHVEVDLPLGVPVTPILQEPGQTFTQARPSTSTATSLGVFFVMVFGMFGFHGLADVVVHFPHKQLADGSSSSC